MNLPIVRWQPGRGWLFDGIRTVGWILGLVGKGFRAGWRPLFGYALVAAVLNVFVAMPLLTGLAPSGADIASLLTAGAVYLVTRHREKMGDRA